MTAERTDDAVVAIRRSRLLSLSNGLHRLVADRMAAATPAERRQVRRVLDRRAARALILRTLEESRTEYIRRIVEAAPPLDDATRERLAAILRPVERTKT